MREYIQEFFTRFAYPCDSAETLLNAYEKLEKDAGFLRLIKEYETQGINCDFDGAFLALKEIANSVRVHEYSAVLLYFICLSKHLKTLYAKMEMDESVWENTVFDLKYKMVECQDVYGVCGTFVGAWFVRFFKLERFAFGKLQFEIVPFETNYDGDGLCLTPESKVLNVHIPRTGGRLEHDGVLVSYSAAKAFFEKYFRFSVPAFVCRSWLLAPWHKEILAPTANLSKFLSDFEIIEYHEYPDYEQLWRLFDCNVKETKIDDLPQNSSLRRAYVERMRRGEPIGYGVGVMDSRNV
jgi:hypothetical protein